MYWARPTTINVNKTSFWVTDSLNIYWMKHFVVKVDLRVCLRTFFRNMGTINTPKNLLYTVFYFKLNSSFHYFINCFWQVNELWNKLTTYDITDFNNNIRKSWLIYSKQVCCHFYWARIPQRARSNCKFFISCYCPHIWEQRVRCDTLADFVKKVGKCFFRHSKVFAPDLILQKTIFKIFPPSIRSDRFKPYRSLSSIQTRPSFFPEKFKLLGNFTLFVVIMESICLSWNEQKSETKHSMFAQIDDTSKLYNKAIRMSFFLFTSCFAILFLISHDFSLPARLI